MPLQDAVLDQGGELRCQSGSVYASVRQELLEPARAEERLAQNQDHPPVAENARGSSDWAG